MRRRRPLIVLPLIALALVAWRAAPRSVEVHTVTIVFQCNGTRAVTPWQVRIKQGDEVRWVLDPSSDVSDFEIEKKRALQRWVFQNEDRHRGNREGPAHGRAMRERADGVHPYNIVAQCPGPGNSMQRAVIDPDIIVDVM